MKRLDNQAPVCDGIDAPYFTSEKFDVTFSAHDDWDMTGTDPYNDAFTRGVTSIQVQQSLNGGSWTNVPILNNAPWTVHMSVEQQKSGTYNFRGILTDTSGNTTTTAASHDVRVDADWPAVSVSTDPALVNESDGCGYASRPVKVTLNATDPSGPATAEYRVGTGGIYDNAPWQAYTAPFTLGEGENYLEAKSVDSVGHEHTEIGRYIIVDTTPPSLELMYPEGSILSSGLDDKCDIFANFHDDISGVDRLNFYVDGKLKMSRKSGELENPYYMGDTYTWDVTKVPDGSWHTVKVAAENRAGLIKAVSRKVQLKRATTAMKSWYFAEGNTHGNFDEYICILNLNKTAANLQFQFLTESGAAAVRSGTVAPNSRATFNVKDLAPHGQNVAASVSSDVPVVCERPMYFNYKNRWTGGHTVMGLNELRKTFYFAEGTTRKNTTDGEFEEWLTLGNFDVSPADVQVTYMTSKENITRRYRVGAASRKTVDVAGEIGLDKDVSIKVVSDKPIAVERPMYFDYKGKWNGGHDVVGASSPQKTFYFAEGSTRTGFEEYICIQNPGDKPAAVKISYTNGTKKSYGVNPRSRHTVSVNGDVGPGKDVSAILESSVPVVCERPMYFNYKGWTGGSAAMGAKPQLKTATTDCYLAEGTTRAGFEEYITIANLNAVSCGKIYVDYVLADGKRIHKFGPNGCPFFVVDNGKRWTINVRDDVGAGKDVSVEIGSEYPIVIERPMYFNYRGWTGGSVGSVYGVGEPQ